MVKISMTLHFNFPSKIIPLMLDVNDVATYIFRFCLGKVEVGIAFLEFSETYFFCSHLPLLYEEDINKVINCIITSKDIGD